MRPCTTESIRISRLFLSFGVLLALVFTADAELYAGAGKQSIVPPFAMHMGGFGDRLDSFTGVHDEIYARALFLDDGVTQVMIIGSGLMALDEELTAITREKINTATGIPAENILISCTHNHSAPSYYQYDTDAEKSKARDFFVQQFAAAGIEAYQNRVLAEAGFRAGEIVGATRNRQQSNEVVIDTQLGVLRVEKKEGREIIAILFNFTGHPVILGSENLLLSGEYPGTASRTIESILGGVAIFTQGACGDVTVHRSGDPFAEVERLGRLIAGEVLKTAEFIHPTENVPLASAYETIQLGRKELLPVAEAERSFSEAESAHEEAKAAGAPRAILRQHENRVRMLSALLRQSRALKDGTLDLTPTYEGSVHVIRIGDLVLVGVPGELFVEYALEMRQRTLQVTGKNLCLVGYANGYLGYIVTPRAMETGGYEASVARVNGKAGRILTERALRIVIRLIR